MIAIHGGACMSAEDEHRHCAKILKESNGDMISAVTGLEKNSRFNCGYGSNLTVTGRVECEAAYMSSRRLAFGTVGAVTNCMTPCVAAKALATKYQNESESWALVPPICLVGEGAEEFCRKTVDASAIVNNEALQTANAKRNFRNASKIMRQQESGRLDTVGGVAVYPDGSSESCLSSGGIILKHDGRLGHCTQFGAGIWSEQRSDISLAISLSGCGEALVRTRLAERLADCCFQNISNSDEYVLGKVTRHIYDLLCNEFLESPRLAAFPADRRLFGGLLMLKSGASVSEMFIFHNSPRFPYAYLNSEGKVRRACSILHENCSSMAMTCVNL